MHYPRAPTPEPCNKERAPTQEPAGALSRPGPGFLVLVSRSWSVSSPCCGPWFLDVLFRGPEVVKKFEEQAFADPITELSSGTPFDAMAGMVWGYFIIDTILERLGYVLPRLRLLCRLSHG